MLPPRMKSPPTAILALLLLLHLGLGVLRLPASVVGRRLREVAACRQVGHGTYALESAGQSGASAIDVLLTQTPADAVVLIRGLRKGAIEFAPALLWPRLCCDESALPRDGDRYAGRPIAAYMLVGDGELLRLEAR